MRVKEIFTGCKALCLDLYQLPAVLLDMGTKIVFNRVNLQHSAKETRKLLADRFSPPELPSKFSFSLNR